MVPVAGARIWYLWRPVACLIFVWSPGGQCSAGGFPFGTVLGIA